MSDNEKNFDDLFLTYSNWKYNTEYNPIHSKAACLSIFNNRIIKQPTIPYTTEKILIFVFVLKNSFIACILPIVINIGIQLPIKLKFHKYNFFLLFLNIFSPKIIKHQKSIVPSISGA